MSLYYSLLFSIIPILYMFRAPLYSSSGESMVLIRHLVYVTLLFFIISNLYTFRALLYSSSGESIALIRHLVYVTLLFSIFPILYMFRAPLCSSSGESIALIHLVYVTLCRWPSGVQVWMELVSSIQTCTPDGHLHRVTYTRCCINTTDSPDDEYRRARNM
jgi:hypothetical protein